MDTLAVVLKEPEKLAIDRLDLVPPTAEDVVVDVEWTGISTGTERLLWQGRMPHFPGLAYPLVPGYEAVGRIAAAGSRSGGTVGSFVFVPGARCYGAVQGLFGAAARRLVVAGRKVLPIEETIGEKGILLALAATARHAIAPEGALAPDLIVGHGVLGRLLARLALIEGGRPVVWETDPGRRAGGEGYTVIDPAEDTRRDYRAIYDVSGDAKILDALIGRMAPGGEIVLAGFYSDPLSFVFPPAFMREARIRIAAQWQPADLAAAKNLIESGALALDGLITHRRDAAEAPEAYRTAFTDPACLKMALDWRPCS